MTERVDIRLPDGTAATVPKADLAQAVAAGAQRVDPRESAQRAAESKAKEKFGGIEGNLIAGELGLARGLTLGVSDQYFAGQGGDVARALLRGYKEENPITSTLTEVGGAILPSVVTGGGAGAAMGTVGAIPRAVGGLGRAVEAGTIGLVGEGATALGRVGRRALASGLAGMAEGAAYGAGAEISDAALDNHELTAEKLLASAGHGAVLGGVLGAGLGGATAATGELGSYVMGKIPEVKGQSIAEWLDNKSGEAFYRSTGATKKMAENADKYGPGFAEYGKRWRDELPGLIGRKVRSTEDLAEGAVLGMNKHGQKLGTVLDAVDAKAAASGGLTKVSDVVADVERLASRIESSTPLSSNIVSRLRNWADDVARIHGPKEMPGVTPRPMVDAPMGLGTTSVHDPVALPTPKGPMAPTGIGTKSIGDALAAPVQPPNTITFKQLRDLRAQVDDIWAPGGMPMPELSGFKKEMHELRSVLEKRVQDGVEQFAGPKASAEYKAAKEGYQAYAALQKAAASGEARGATNLAFGLTDKISGGAGAIVGSMLGGGMPGALIGGAVATGVNKLVRSPAGGFVTAEIASKLSKLAAMERLAAQVDRKMADGVAGFLTKSKAVAREQVAAFGVKNRQATMRQAQNVLRIANDPALLTQRVSQAAGGLGADAPNITAALGNKAMAAVSFLASKAPKGRVNAHSLTLMKEPVRVSDAELARFQRYLDGVQDPMSLLDDMKKGALSREKVEAVKSVYPELFGKMRSEVMQQVHRRGERLPYEKKMQVAIMFGTPVDETQTSEFIQKMQASAAGQADMKQKAQDAAPDQTQEMGGRRPFEADSSMYQTSAEAVEAR